MFWKNCENVQNASDVKTAIILIEFLVDQNKTSRTIFNDQSIN